MEKFKIYKHTSPSGKVYIGQTREKSVIQRWRNGGKGYLSINPKTGEYDQPFIANAINKYPWDEWEHEIITECTTQEEADYLESYYIKLYKSNDRNYGYNLTAGGRGHLGQEMKSSTKEKLSEAVKELWKNPEYRNKTILGMKGKSMHENTKNALLKANTGRMCSEETRKKIKKAHSKIVLQYSINGEFIAQYDDCVDTGKTIGVGNCAISNCCIGKSKKCKNYIFLYKCDLDNNPNLLEERINLINNKKSAAKKILQYSKNDEFISEYSSITEASNVTNIKLTSISNCLKERSKSAGGFIWKYKNDDNN